MPRSHRHVTGTLCVLCAPLARPRTLAPPCSSRADRSHADTLRPHTGGLPRPPACPGHPGSHSASPAEQHRDPDTPSTQVPVAMSPGTTLPAPGSPSQPQMSPQGCWPPPEWGRRVGRCSRCSGLPQGGDTPWPGRRTGSACVGRARTLHLWGPAWAWCQHGGRSLCRQGRLEVPASRSWRAGKPRVGRRGRPRPRLRSPPPARSQAAGSKPRPCPLCSGHADGRPGVRERRDICAQDELPASPARAFSPEPGPQARCPFKQRGCAARPALPLAVRTTYV